MRTAHSRLALLVALTFLLLGACSIPTSLTEAAVPGSGHGGWGPPRAAEATPAAGAPARETDSPAAEPRRTDATTAVQQPAGERPRSTEASAPARPQPQSATASATQPAASTASARGGAPQVNRISFAERSDGRGYVVRIHTTGAIPAWNEQVLDRRIQLTLFQTDIGSSLRRADPTGPIASYELESADGRTVLVIDLGGDVHFEPRAYPDRDSDDLLLSLTYAPRPTPIASAASGSALPVRPAATGTGSADAASREHWRFDCIVIDPGHGGRDPGAVANGVRESDVTLGIAQKVGRYVEDELGIRVVYTRRDNRFVDLAERGRIANQSCGKLFVSIHANSAANRQAHGTETYFLGLHRSESARRVMERENAVIALESDPSLYSGMDEASLIMQTMAQSTYLRVSEQLAGLIENQFQSTANRQSRGVKQAGFLVLWAASMPAVLIETGFISNPAEARFLSSEQGQDQIARSIFRAIKEYKQQYERGLGLASS